MPAKPGLSTTAVSMSQLSLESDASMSTKDRVKPGLLILIDVRSLVRATSPNHAVNSLPSNAFDLCQIDLSRLVRVIRTKGGTVSNRPLSSDTAFAVVPHTQRIPIMSDVRQLAPPARLSSDDHNIPVDPRGAEHIIVRFMAEDYTRVELLGCASPGRTFCLVTGDPVFVDVVKRARYATCDVEQWFWTSSPTWSATWLAEESDQHRSHGSFAIHDLAPFDDFLSRANDSLPPLALSDLPHPTLTRHNAHMTNFPSIVNSTWAHHEYALPDVAALTLSSVRAGDIVSPYASLTNAQSAPVYCQSSEFLNAETPPFQSGSTLTQVPWYSHGSISGCESTARIRPLRGDDDAEREIEDVKSEEELLKEFYNNHNDCGAPSAQTKSENKLHSQDNLIEHRHVQQVCITTSTSKSSTSVAGKTYASVTKHAPSDDWTVVGNGRLSSKPRLNEEINIVGDDCDEDNMFVQSNNGETLGDMIVGGNVRDRCWLREFCQRTDCMFAHTAAEYEFWKRNGGNRYHLAKQKACTRQLCNPARAKWKVCTYLHEEVGERPVCAACLRMHDRTTPCEISRENPIDDAQAKVLLKRGYITEVI